MNVAPRSRRQARTHRHRRTVALRIRPSPSSRAALAAVECPNPRRAYGAPVGPTLVVAGSNFPRRLHPPPARPQKSTWGPAPCGFLRGGVIFVHRKGAGSLLRKSLGHHILKVWFEGVCCVWSPGSCDESTDYWNRGRGRPVLNGLQRVPCSRINFPARSGVRSEQCYGWFSRPPQAGASGSHARL